MKDGVVGFFISGWYMFDNFAPFQVEWRGVLYPTSEHAYHASKFIDLYPDIANAICLCRSPLDAANLAHKNELYRNSNWYNSGEAEKVMEDILRAKLNQHKIIRDVLIQSGNMNIVELNDSDDFWGWGSDHRGDNRLGKIWMKLRRELLT